MAERVLTTRESTGPSWRASACSSRLDGAVAGIWKHRGGRIERTPFERLDAAQRRALDTEGERLASFYARAGCGSVTTTTARSRRT